MDLPAIRTFPSESLVPDCASVLDITLGQKRVSLAVCIVRNIRTLIDFISRRPLKPIAIPIHRFSFRVISGVHFLLLYKCFPVDKLLPEVVICQWS